MLSDSVILILASGMPVACKLSTQGSMRRWIAVFPFKIHPVTGMPTLNEPTKPWKYRIRCFGLPVGYDYDNYDVHEENLTNFENVVVDDLDGVESVVVTWLEDVTNLTDCRNVDCPIC